MYKHIEFIQRQKNNKQRKQKQKKIKEDKTINLNKMHMYDYSKCTLIYKIFLETTNKQNVTEKSLSLSDAYKSVKKGEWLIF